MSDTIYCPDAADWERVLVGHRIVGIEQMNDESAVLCLENGTKIGVRGNEGCGGCSNGYYYVSHIANVANIITAVHCEVDPRTNEYDEEAYTYRVFVLTEAEEINIVTVEGDDGNGYYGSGYYLELLNELED